MPVRPSFFVCAKCRGYFPLELRRNLMKPIPTDRTLIDSGDVAEFLVTTKAGGGWHE